MATQQRGGAGDVLLSSPACPIRTPTSQLAGDAGRDAVKPRRCRRRWRFGPQKPPGSAAELSLQPADGFSGAFLPLCFSRRKQKRCFG